MKDVEKTNVERQNSRKRMRRRSRNNGIYGLIVALIVLTAGITICYTFLFNVSKIKVSGESDTYTAEEIVAASGIKEGDNLLRLGISESEKNILDRLLWVETATVKRDFPTSVEIYVTKCVPAFYVSSGNQTLLVSRRGKILENTGAAGDDYPIIYGYDPAVTEKGKVIASVNERKDEAFSELMKSLSDDNSAVISTVDMSDEFSIIVNYKNGMIFRMGGWTDVEYKLSLADSVMQDESVKGKKGYLTMIGTNQCSFRTTTDRIEANGTIEPPTKPKVDANGNPIETTTVSGESDPDQQALFIETEPTTVYQEEQYQDYNNGQEQPDYNNGQDYGNGQDYNNGQDQWQPDDGGYNNGGYDNGGYNGGGNDNGGNWNG